MKKLFISIIMLMLLASIPVVAASDVLMDMSNEYTWSENKKRGGAVEITSTSTGGMAILSFNSSRESVASVESPVFNATKQYLKITFTMTESEGAHEDNEKLVELTVDSTKKELIKLVQGKLSVLGEEVMVDNAQYILTPGIAHDMTIYIGNGKLMVTDGTITVTKDFTAGTSLKLGFKNEMTKVGVQTMSEFKVENALCEQAPAISYTTPADDVNRFSSEELSDFRITTQGYLHKSMYQEGNYEVRQDGRLLDEGVSVTNDNGTIVISIDGGFVPGSYSIKMKSSKDILNTEAATPVDVSFTVVSEDYDPDNNKIELALSDAVLTEGQKAVVTGTAVSEESPMKKIELYVDDSLYETIYNEGFERELLLDAGEHEVYAVVVTESGARIRSNVVTVTVSANDAPRVSFEGYTGTANLNVNTNRSITVLAEDTDEIKCVELYRADVLLTTMTQAPYVFDISSVGLGEHQLKAVAYDVYGKSGTAMLTAIVNNFFETGEDDEAVESNTNIAYDTKDKVGYAGIEKIDGNDCIAVGKDETAYDGATSGAYFQYNFSSDKQKLGFVFEYDMNILDKPADGINNCVNMILRYVNKDLDTFMNIQNGKITWRNNIGSGFAYTEGQWYNVVMTLDIVKGVFRVEIKQGETVVWTAEEAYDAATVSTKDGFHCIRFTAPNKGDAESCKIAVDNIRVRSLVYAPTVVGTGDAQNTALDIIDSAAKTVWIYLSDEINADDVTVENITLWRVDEIKCNAGITWHSDKKAIEVKPVGGFLPSTKYSVKIAAGVKMSDGITPLGGELRAEFETSAAIKINDVTFETRADGLVAKIDVSSQSGEPEQFYAVSSIWQGDVFVRTYAQPISLDTPGITEIVYTDNLMGKRIELYLLSSLNSPRMIAKQIYTNIR